MNGRAFYRNTYLRSEHWKSLRLEKLTAVDACCFRCGERNLSNDVHHTNYRQLYDVTLDDLIVLCRPCHVMMHEVLDAIKNGSLDDVKEMAERIKTLRGQGLKQIPQMGRIFKRLREETKPAATPVAKPEILKCARWERAKRVSIRLTLGFSGPDTKWLFVALRKVGFIADLHRAYTSQQH